MANFEHCQSCTSYGNFDSCERILDMAVASEDKTIKIYAEECELALALAPEKVLDASQASIQQSREIFYNALRSIGCDFSPEQLEAQLIQVKQ